MKRKSESPSPTRKSFRFDAAAVPAAARRVRAAIRRRCLALPGAVEEFPWGGSGVYKVRGKIFVSTDVHDGVYEAAFKPPEAEREEALSLPFVRVADYVGRYGWVQAALTGTAQAELIWPWIEASHARLAGKNRGGR
jgi:predicted DNA-binding protein (MmcQ/YjbR family)